MLSSLSLSLPLLGLLLQISTSHASPASLTSPHALSSTTTPPPQPDFSLMLLQVRDSSSSTTTVKSYSGNLLITFAPVPTTISGTPTTLSASTPSGQGAVATPYPLPPPPPGSGLSIGEKAAIGAGAVVVCIFLSFALCCVAAQTRQKRANRRLALNGGQVQGKDGVGVGLMDLRPMAAGPGEPGPDRKFAGMGPGAR
jgi:hypothetical protein